MNPWRSRLCLGVLFGLVMAAHAALMRFKPHGEWGMTLFYASAAFFDWFLFRICPRLVRGRLCDNMQWLCILSMFGNALGWGLYMNYAPPMYYYGYMWALTGVQALRLLITDDDATTLIWGGLFRRHPLGRARAILETEKR